MEEPQGQNRFFERCAQMLLELSDELERNLYIEAIVKDYRGYGISVEDLSKACEYSGIKGNSCRTAGSSPKLQEHSRQKRDSASREGAETDADLAGHLSGYF